MSLIDAETPPRQPANAAPHTLEVYRSPTPPVKENEDNGSIQHRDDEEQRPT